MAPKVKSRKKAKKVVKKTSRRLTIKQQDKLQEQLSASETSIKRLSSENKELGLRVGILEQGIREADKLIRKGGLLNIESSRRHLAEKRYTARLDAEKKETNRILQSVISASVIKAGEKAYKKELAYQDATIKEMDQHYSELLEAGENLKDKYKVDHFVQDIRDQAGTPTVSQ